MLLRFLSSTVEQVTADHWVIGSTPVESFYIYYLMLINIFLFADILLYPKARQNLI